MRPSRIGEAGFALIELLVVVAMVGTLVTVAISQLFRYRARALDAEMQAALHSARNAIEAFYESNNYSYVGVTVADLRSKGYRASADVTLTIVAATSSDFTLRACAAGGTSTSFVLETTSGGIRSDTGTCS